MIETSLFPYSNFDVRLEQTGENRICWFKDDHDLQKHIERYKLDKRKLKIFYRNEEPIQSSETDKNKVRQRKPKTNTRGSNTTRKRTKSVDTSGNLDTSSKSNSKKGHLKNRHKTQNV